MKRVSTVFIATCAPLLALGVGAAPCAWAAPPAGPSPHGPSVSVSVNGTQRTPSQIQGGSTATTDPGTGSVAVAVNGSTAIASGIQQRAVAVNGSTASVVQGTGNTATAINNSTAAQNIQANNLTLRAINDSVARAAGHPLSDASGSTATALNGGQAFVIGQDATATATCGGTAVAGFGQTVTDRGSSCGG